MGEWIDLFPYRMWVCLGQVGVLRECLLLSGWPGQPNDLIISPLYHNSHCRGSSKKKTGNTYSWVMDRGWSVWVNFRFQWEPLFLILKSQCVGNNCSSSWTIKGDEAHADNYRPRKHPVYHWAFPLPEPSINSWILATFATSRGPQQWRGLVCRRLLWMGRQGPALTSRTSMRKNSGILSPEFWSAQPWVFIRNTRLGLVCLF